MWTVVRVAFLMDYKIGRIKVCGNPDCVTPYFVESRKGQEFCSHKCAVLINVRRFRERQSKAEARGRTKR
jgi:predicted RNA-binding Zn ribbon-like protein